MSNNKMLIDATHPEETRVVVLREGRVEEFDFESAARKPLRGNIYLAKVTRVEPSLQAAFIEYGGNRHGFLAFNEIHPDYYQIPVADRQALIDEEAAAEAEEEAEVDAEAESPRRSRRRRSRAAEGSDNGGDDYDTDEQDDGHDAEPDSDGEALQPAEQDGEAAGGEHASVATHEGLDAPRITEHAHAASEPVEDAAPSAEAAGDEVVGEPSDAPAPIGLVEDVGIQEVGNGNGEAEAIEEVGTAEDALEEVRYRPRRRSRSYKIQEVIKRRQVILVQVVKEERGNKGAALTTYLSLAGRYTVLMPNTARGGGISRKITQPQDRKRLKAIAAELDVPDGMGLIIRTAGAARTKQEIKRDFEYLLRLWENVREMTLQSTAPNLVYEEGDLIKRSIRDHYTKDVDEILVAGDAAFHEARDFMGMLMPSHAKNVIDYKEPEPLFTRFQIERQLNAMFSPFVTLRSGGYLVINQTEALVAIDVNSGKSTREFSIEETALNTNLEASDEIARQLKLRDLAGLIVVDYIDMEEKRNNRAVERRLKDALRFDRARIQVGRISHFGLLEMSRQRLRTGVLEGSTSQCPHCQGTGMIRSTESVALAVLRGLEDALLSGQRASLNALTTAQVALYILNNKRAFINEMEKRSGVTITVQASDKMQGANFAIERGAAPVQPARRPDRVAVNMDWGFTGASDNEPPEEAPEAGYAEVDDADDAVDASDDRGGEGGSDGDRRGRRRRRRRGRRGERGDSDTMRGERASGPRAEFEGSADNDADDRGDNGDHRGHVVEVGGEDSEAGDEQAETAGGASEGVAGDDRGADDRRGRRRRRGRRGGRKGGRERMPGEGGEGVPGSEELGFEAEPGAPRQPGGHDADSIAGQGPQPDVEVYAVLPDPSTLPVRKPPAERRRERIEIGEPSHVASNVAPDVAHGEPAQAEPVLPPFVAAEPVSEPEPAPALASVEIEPAPPVAVAPPAAPAVVEETAPPPRPRRTNGDPQAIVPKIERVVVKPDEVKEATPTEPPAQSESASGSARKGWWQRKLGV